MHRIRLGNTVFEGRNNAYLLDGDRTVLVDTGIAAADVEAELSAGLAERGVAFADVDEVFLTHWHYDHSGLAGAIQDAGGATVRVHEADAPLVAGDPAAVRENEDARERYFEAWGIPDEKRAALRSYLDEGLDLAGEPTDVMPFEDGETFDVGDRTLEAVHLPGHAAGLSAFAFHSPDDRAAEEAFVGDAVLPVYTPNVGGADVRVERPLATYVDSLERVIDRDFARVHPGHRDPIEDPAGRAATIIRHHRERTDNVVAALREHGPCDAWTVSAALFGELEEIHVLHGPGEAYAHLDHLVHAGVVERDGTDYRLVDPEPDVDALFPDLPDDLGTAPDAES